MSKTDYQRGKSDMLDEVVAMVVKMEQFWQAIKKDKSHTKREMAIYYIDAYKSVLANLDALDDILLEKGE